MVRIPLEVGGVIESARMVGFDGLRDGKEHVAILFGEPTRDPAPLVRVHSECLASEVFGSMSCDCGPRLRASMRIMRASGGIILYLRQEGRGAGGLYNRLEASRMPHFAEDPRNCTVAAQMLLGLGVREARLLSGSPENAAQLGRLGVTVREQPEHMADLSGNGRRSVPG